MNKMLFLLFFCLNVCPCAFGAGYEFESSEKVSDTIYAAWGSPVFDNNFIQDSITGPGQFRIKEGWACCGNSAQDAENNNRDDASIMAFSARAIYEHGGKFCLTQFAAASGTSRFWLYKQEPNWPGLGCAVFCEPGWDGPKCATPSSENAGCNATDYAAGISKVKEAKYTGNDALSLHNQRSPAPHAYFKKALVKNFYPHAVILGASKFMQHGIVAQPVLLGVVGDHPAITAVSSGPAGGATKVLCAQGFTKNDKCEIISKNCGSNVWCSGYSDDKFNSSIHNKQMNGLCNIIVCKNGGALDDNFKCVECYAPNGHCSVATNEKYGRCVKCDYGRIFNAETCECTEARSVSMEIMQYGVGGTSSVKSDQCWTKEAAADFKACIEAGAVYGAIPPTNDTASNAAAEEVLRNIANNAGTVGFTKPTTIDWPGGNLLDGTVAPTAHTEDVFYNSTNALDRMKYQSLLQSMKKNYSVMQQMLP